MTVPSADSCITRAGSLTVTGEELSFLWNQRRIFDVVKHRNSDSTPNSVELELELNTLNTQHTLEQHNTTPITESIESKTFSQIFILICLSISFNRTISDNCSYRDIFCR